MIVLDTNVLSALMRHPPDTGVVEWLDKQPRTSIWTTSITILEIRYGLHILPIGKRRSALLQAFERVLVEKIENRVAPFDTAAAQQERLDSRSSQQGLSRIDRKSTRLNSSHTVISYAVFCLKKITTWLQ